MPLYYTTCGVIPFFAMPQPVVYFIADRDGHIKIGYTKNGIAERLSRLQTGSSTPLYLLGTISGDIELERSIHRKFKHLRIRKNGEWFKAAPELVAFIGSDPHAEKLEQELNALEFKYGTELLDESISALIESRA